MQCNEKQSQRKVFASSTDAKEIRLRVGAMNRSRGEQAEKQAVLVGQARVQRAEEEVRRAEEENYQARRLLAKHAFEAQHPDELRLRKGEEVCRSSQPARWQRVQLPMAT